MDIKDLITKFSDTRENQCKAIFSTIFIAGNRLQTIFDNAVPEISLKQFMLLTVIRNTKEQLTFTQLGELLGCSRQNIKKLAFALEKKGYVILQKNKTDIRTYHICPTDKLELYFENVFASYQKDLQYLFDVYSPEEIEQLFQLIMKLYKGIEHLKKHAQKAGPPKG